MLRRIELPEALLQDVMQRTVQVEIATLELDHGRPTETYETVEQLSSQYPERHFKWVFGSDSIASMPSWRGGEWLLENIHIIAIDRPGEPSIEYGGDIEKLSVQTDDIRSTEVRRRMARGEDYGELVGAHVAELLAV